MSDNLPVNWTEELAASAKEIAKTERASVQNISLRAGMMQLGGIPVPGNKLDCVVVASVFERRYYAESYDPDNPQSPHCFSFSLTGVGMTPHAQVTSKQADLCANCPMNEWGTSLTGGRGKACKEVRRLAVLPAKALLDGNIKGSETATMTLPVTSVKHWGNYVNELAATASRPPWAVLTEISVTPDVKTQFRVGFALKGLVADEYLGQMRDRIVLAQNLLMQPYEKIEPKQEVQKPDNKKRKY